MKIKFSTNIMTGFLVVTLITVSACSSGCNSSSSPPPPDTSMGTALVALFNTDELAQVNLDTGNIESIIPSSTTGIKPFGVIGDDKADLAYVLDNNKAFTRDGSAHEFDLMQTPVSATGRIAPVNSAYGREGWEGVKRGGTLYLIDSFSGFYSWNGSAISSTSIPGAQFFWDIEANAAGTRFYIADFSTGSTGPSLNGAIFVVDNSGSVIGTFFYDNQPSVGITTAGPNALALSPDERTLYAAQSGTDWAESTDDLIVFDLDSSGDTLTFNRKIPLKDSVTGDTVNLYYSKGLVVTPDGSKVFVAGDATRIIYGPETDKGTIAVVDVLSDTVKVNVLGSSYHPAEVRLDKRGSTVIAASDSYIDTTPTTDSKLFLFDAVDGSLASSIALPVSSQPVHLIVY